jgi:type IV secretion system protein VirD4
MERDGLGAFELLVLLVGGAVVLLVGVTWAGAVVASGVAGHMAAPSLGEAATAARELPARVGDPGSAWPASVAADLPGPVAYWVSTLVAAVAIGGLTWLLVRWLLAPRVGSAKRWPLGVDGRAMFARTADLRPVLVRRPEPGRFVVGRRGRWLVATEAPTRRRGRRLRRTDRRGDRGAVALIGPSRSGKTTAAVSGILEWEGPAVLSSVKSDLLAATVGWRSQQGGVRVYDPTRTLARSPLQAAIWSPVGQGGTVVGAQRAARALCEAAPRGGVEGGIDFWLAQAEILLSGLLYIAHHAHKDMGRVCEWVLLQDRPGDLGPGEVQTYLDDLLGHPDEEVMLGAGEASRGVKAIWEMEDRTRSSVYATAQTVVWPWSEPEVAASSRGRSVDLEWVLAGSNTVYLCAPIEDQRRLSPAFGGLLSDLIAQVYRRVAATGRPLDPPLLVVIDEAGNTPLRSLPEYASTLAGLGVLLVTIWQSLAQIEAAYERQADTILTNHLTKLFYAGLSDPASLRYVAQVLGDTEVETRSVTTGEQFGRSSSQLATSNLALAPPHALRQMRPGDALLLHGTLPPAHVRTRPFYRDRRLAARAAVSPPDERKSRPAHVDGSTLRAWPRPATHLPAPQDERRVVPGDRVDGSGA